MIDPLIKIIKRSLGDRVEVRYFMDDLKASTTNIEAAQAVHETVKFAACVVMVVNNKKNTIKLNAETPTPCLSGAYRGLMIRRRYLGFEMKGATLREKK